MAAAATAWKSLSPFSSGSGDRLVRSWILGGRMKFWSRWKSWNSDKVTLTLKHVWSWMLDKICNSLLQSWLWNVETNCQELLGSFVKNKALSTVVLGFRNFRCEVFFSILLFTNTLFSKNPSILKHYLVSPLFMNDFIPELLLQS